MRVISGKEFLGNLIERGILPANARRVVIEADVSSIVHVYYGCLGTEELLGVEMTGAQIRVIKPKEAGEDAEVPA